MMTIIEVEGTNVQPLDVDEIQIFAGQRYSFVVSTYMKSHITSIIDAGALIIAECQPTYR